MLALPLGVEGLSGDAEERFFGRLRDSASRPSRASSRLLLTALLPGLLAGDIDEFGAALTEIQREMGSIFAAQQGGVFHPRAAPLVDALQTLGVGAVGQSSWGPTVYGIVDGPERAADVADRLRVAAGAGTDVSVVDFDRRGAWVAHDGIGAASRHEAAGQRRLRTRGPARPGRRRRHHRRQGSGRGRARGAIAARAVRGGGRRSVAPRR